MADWRGVSKGSNTAGVSVTVGVDLWSRGIHDVGLMMKVLARAKDGNEQIILAAYHWMHCA